MGVGCEAGLARGKLGMEGRLEVYKPFAGSRDGLEGMLKVFWKDVLGTLAGSLEPGVACQEVEGARDSATCLGEHFEACRGEDGFVDSDHLQGVG